MTDDKLKPCPFCGSTDVSSGESLVSEDAGYGKQTGCEACGALGPVVRITDEQVLGTDGDDLADEAWNRRAALSQPSLSLQMDGEQGSVHPTVTPAQRRYARPLEKELLCLRCRMPQSACDYQRNFPDPDPII